MANICPVCNKKILLLEDEPQPGIFTHPSCEVTFLQNPEKYGGKAIEKTKKNPEKYGGKAIEKTKSWEEIEFKENEQIQSVYVRGFSMPFGEMVIFALKWMLALIPAFILFWIIIAGFTAIFGISLLGIF